jgi:hypothetical protein
MKVETVKGRLDWKRLDFSKKDLKCRRISFMLALRYCELLSFIWPVNLFRLLP